MGKDDVVEALRARDFDRAKAAIEAGGDVNGRDSYGRTALLLAIWGKSKTLVKLLVEKGADVNAAGKDDDGLTPVNALAENLRDVKLLELLVSKGAKVDVKDKKEYYGRTALHRAVRSNLPFAQALVAAGAGLEVKDDQNGDTPLLWACRSASGVMNAAEEAGAKWLIEKGADIHATNDNLETPLHRAVESGSIATVKLLFAAGAKLTKTKQGSTPIHYTMGTNNKNEAMWKLLLDAGDGKDEPNSEGDTPLMNAVTNACKAGVKFLIAHGADPNKKGGDGKSPIEKVLEWGERPEMLALLQTGVKKSATSKAATPAPKTAKAKAVAAKTSKAAAKPKRH